MEKRKMSKKKITLIVLGVIVGILLLGTGTVYGIFHHYHGKTNYVKDDEIKELDEEEIPEEVLLENQEDVSAEEAKEEEEKALASQKEMDFPNGDYVYNLLLIGVDLRPDKYLPDKAIDIIDECAAKINTQINSNPIELDNVNRKIGVDGV